MMARGVVVLVVAGMLGVRLSHAAGGRPSVRPGPCVEASPGGPADIVRALYADYPWGKRPAVQNESRAVLQRFFADALTELLLADRECRRREQRLCNIDSSILYDAQDGDISGVTVCAPQPHDGNPLLRVWFTNSGEAKSVTYEMEQTRS